MATSTRWIIIEDDPDVLEIVSAMCQIWDVDPIKLTSGDAAAFWIEHFRAGRYIGPLPQLTISDIRLPGLQGHEVAQRLRQIPELKAMAIILMTAYRLSQQEKDEIMRTSQADMLLYKPLPRLMEFNRLVREAIASRQAKAKGDSTTSQPPPKSGPS